MEFVEDEDKLDQKVLDLESYSPFICGYRSYCELDVIELRRLEDLAE